MSEFTQIGAEEEVIIPAREEKKYDKLYIKNIRFISRDGKMSVAGNLIPFNGEDTLEEPITQVVIEDIFEAMSDGKRPKALRTLMAQTMELLLQTVKGELEYQKTVEVEEEPIEK